jgi:hypothetical protein
MSKYIQYGSLVIPATKDTPSSNYDGFIYRDNESKPKIERSATVEEIQRTFGKLPKAITAKRNDEELTLYVNQRQRVVQGKVGRHFYTPHITEHTFPTVEAFIGMEKMQTLLQSWCNEIGQDLSEGVMDELCNGDYTMIDDGEDGQKFITAIQKNWQRLGTSDDETSLAEKKAAVAQAAASGDIATLTNMLMELLASKKKR